MFEKYAELLKTRFSEDFQEVISAPFYSPVGPLLTFALTQIVSTDDYMPMAINSPEEYEKVVNVSWFAQPSHELTYVVFSCLFRPKF